MKTFVRAYVNDEQIEHIANVLKNTYPDMDVEKIIADVTADEIYLNDQYQVSLRRFFVLDNVPMVHLSVRRLDREAIHDWRDMQEIKNMLVGMECEGVELYPAESRLVDTSNQFHCWVFADPEARFPFGFGERFVSGEVLLPDLPNIKQRERG